MDRMMLEAAFDGHPRMKRAYRARNQFRKIFALKSRQAADAALREWEESLHPSIAPAFEGVTRALENWRTEILNFFTARYTNGRVEGLNRAIQQIQAEGAGYSFEALRAKVIYGLERRREAREEPTVLYSQFPPPPDVLAGHYGLEDPRDTIRPGVPFDRIADDLSGLLAKWDLFSPEAQKRHSLPTFSEKQRCQTDSNFARCPLLKRHKFAAWPLLAPGLPARRQRAQVIEAMLENKDNPCIESQRRNFCEGRTKTEVGSRITESSSLPKLRDILDERFQHYNQERRHSSIGYVPPRDHLNNALFTSESESGITAAS
jgi:hypothetical protein